jgi:FKBP-type peptidyl-prolyl cis-trans isomerase
MDEATANTFMNSYINKLQAEKAEPRILEGEKFLALNKTKPGVLTTASGLQYEILTAGSGPKADSPLDTVVCHYRGTFLDGAGFDNSYDRNEPTTFQLNEVVRGWTEGLQLMPVGSKYRFWVSHTLGYGANDYMAIPGGSTLVFEIELLEVRKKK